MSASEMREFRKYKKQLRLDLNKKYPKGGAKFIKELQQITSFSFKKYQALGVKSVSNETVKEKIKSSKKINPNIVKTKKEIKKVITPSNKKTNVVKDNKKTGSKTAASASNTKDFKKTKELQMKLNNMGADIKADGIMGPKTRAAMKKFSSSSKKVSDMTTKEVMERGRYGLKSGGKGTYEQRQNEIRKEKANPNMKKAKLNQPDKSVIAKSQKSIDAIYAMIKKDKEFRKKEKTNVKLKNGGMTMKKKTKYMAKGGYGTPTKKMVMKAGGTAKKTKYMAKGGMKKTKYMAKGGVAKRK